MVVMTPRETWTDERLDEFKASVNQRFDEVDRRLDRIDADIREIRGELSQIREGMEAMQRTMVHGAIGMCSVMIAGFVALASLAVF
jgi:tetrahydromethanopterin S-methyltransferase subunit G